MKHPAPTRPVVTIERSAWQRAQVELENLRKALGHYADCPHTVQGCACTTVARAQLYGVGKEQP